MQFSINFPSAPTPPNPTPPQLSPKESLVMGMQVMVFTYCKFCIDRALFHEAVTSDRKFSHMEMSWTVPPVRLIDWAEHPEKPDPKWHDTPPVFSKVGGPKMRTLLALWNVALGSLSEGCGGTSDPVFGFVKCGPRTWWGTNLRKNIYFLPLRRKCVDLTSLVDKHHS